MKIRIIASALLIMLLSLGMSSDANAQHDRDGRGWHGGWRGSRIGVGIDIPAPQVVIGGSYYDPGYDPGIYGGYYGPAYYGGYYDHPYYHDGDYGRGQYRGEGGHYGGDHGEHGGEGGHYGGDHGGGGGHYGGGHHH